MMQPRPNSINRNVPIALQRAREAVMGFFRPLLAERGYTEQQWRVMRVLDDEGAMDASLLAQKAVLLMPSLTRILSALEDQGMIKRVRDQDDRRRTLISLTDAARSAINAAAPSTIAAYAEIEEQFGTKNMEQLLALLAKLAEVERKK